jgi:MoaA/NifB/PqqE/SkfB family radical SAM enzyme
MITKIARLRAPKKYSVINIEGCNFCNLKCTMCPHPLITRKKDVLPLDLYQKIIVDAYELGIGTVNLNIYNEPLMDPFIIERIKFAKAAGMFVQFTSNGTLLTPEKSINVIYEGVDRVYFSFDGCNRSTYESIRIGANYSDVIANICKLIDTRNAADMKTPKVEIVATLQDSNRHQVRALHRMWRTANSVYCWPVDNRKKETQASGKPYPCWRVFSELNVNANGHLILCCLDYNGDFPLGDLKEHRLIDIVNGPLVEFAKDTHINNEGRMLDICKGCDNLYNGKSHWLGELLPSPVKALAREINQRRLRY